MEQDIAHDWDDTPEDEQKALDVISSHHHLVYHMLNPNFRQNLAIIKEHFTVSSYHENQILSTATSQESNARILKFLEDKYAISCDYDEFFVILRKLIEMPQAMPIIDSFQKKINECFKERREKERREKERREKEKLQSKNGTTPTTSSSTVSAIQKESPPPVQNGLSGQHHRPSAPTAEAESSDDGTGTQEMSAKSIVSSIVTEVLHSTPGYHILESYKERVCESLPADYNSTALRLQPLIGASDHMIEWILTGDTSKANHRIYQVVLVYVCFEPHFIRFCDIMEVLAAGSMTAAYIVELRENLIKHLYSDGHITAEEASQLTSKKLFEVPAPPIGSSSNGASNNTTTAPAVTHASTIDKLTAVFNVLRNLTINNSTVSTTGPTVSGVPPPGLASLPQLPNSHLGVTVTDTQPSITVTPNTPVASSLAVFPSRMPKQNGPADSVTTAGTVVVTSRSVLQAPAQKVVTSGDTGDDGSHTASSAVSDASSNEDQSYYDDLVYDQTTDENTTNGSTTKVTKIPDQRLTATTTATSATTSRGPSPVATLKLGSTTPANKDVKSVTVELTQAGAGSQSSIDQVIDSIVDYNVLSLNGIAQFLLSPPNERSVILMEAYNRVNKKSSETSSRVQDFGESEDTTEVQKSSGLELLQAKYAEILACFPENYGNTIECLQSYLDDSDIAQIVSLPSGHNQKILDCLIQKVKREEDLLDFCEVLDKISEAPPLLKLIVEQIRKGVIEKLQTMASPVKSSPVLGNLDMASIPVGPVPIMPPPSKIIPEIIDPFEDCPLPRDSEGLTILKQSYPSLLKSLSSNHMTTLTRLQNVVKVPEDKVDSIKTAPNSDIGNEMILSYLISLILTENDIITFCNMVEKMIGGDPEKCESVANLQIAVSSVLQQHKEETTSTKEEDTKKAASSSNDANVPSPIKTVDTDDTTLSSDDDLKKPQKESEHGDMSLAADKSKEASAGGETVVSEKDVKEDSGVTTQVTKTETVTSSEEALPGPKLNVGTQAALKAFNAYRPQLQALDAVEVGKRLIRYRLIPRKGGTQSGEAVHLPNEIKMNLMLPEVERNISLNGPEVLFMLATALSELPSCVELSTQLKDAYQGYRYSSGALINPQSNPRTQQHVGMHSVVPRNVLPYTNQPQHTAVTGVSVHPQKTEGDSHKITTASNTATSTPVPSTTVDSTKKQGPALIKCTEETAAVMATFDEYSSLLQESINPFVFIPKCISYGILRGDVTAGVGGGAIFLTNQMKMEIVICELRNIVFERGIEVFKKILYVLRTEPIYVEVADHIESVYKIYKDPVARQKHKQKLAEAKVAPASEMDPIDTEAALAAFDEYYDLAHEFVEINVEMFTSKCVGYGVIPETSSITGASVFLPDSLKMGIVLPLIRKNIALNGKAIFHLMTRVLESMGDFRQLAKGYEKIFEEKRQALIAQQSQEVTTETTTVTASSGTAPNVNEVAVTSTAVINQLNVQKPQAVTTATTTTTAAAAATTTTTAAAAATTTTTTAMYKQFSLNIQKLPFLTPVSTVPGETTEERLKRLKAKVAAEKAAKAAAEAAAQQQHHSSGVSVQQSTNTTGTTVQDNPKPQPNIDQLVGKGLQPPSLPDNHICRPKLLDELVQKMLSNKPDPSTLSVAAVITGASGFGKTTLAKALCHDPQIIKSFQDGFIFIQLGPKATNPVSNLNKLYSQLTSKAPEQDNIESVVMELRHTTGAYFHNLLVILDDVCEANDAIPYIKAFSNCSIVLTTQLDNISQVISARIELTVSEMEMEEAIALISEASIKKNDVSIMVSSLAEDLHRWPLLLRLASCQINHFQKQQQQLTPEVGAISLTKKRLQEKNLTTLNQSSDKDKHRKTAVQACVELSLEMIGDGLTEQLMIYVLFTGIGCSLSTTVVHMLWQTTESDAEQVVKTLLSHGLIHVKTSCGKYTSVAIHTVIAQYLLDSMNASKILQLGSYQGPNVMSIDAAVDKTCGITLPLDDLECLKVILNIIDYAELPCRLRKLTGVVIQSPASLTSIIQEFDEQVLGLPEYEEIKNKFQNTLNALVDECSEILAITVKSAVTLNTDVYKLIQANSHNNLVKNIELLCRNKLIGEIASKFLNILNEFMSMQEDDLCDKGQKAFEQIQALEQYNDSVVLEFTQIKLVVEVRERITEALASGIDAQVNKACQYVKSGVLAEKLAKIKENHQSKLKET